MLTSTTLSPNVLVKVVGTICDRIPERASIVVVVCSDAEVVVRVSSSYLCAELPPGPCLFSSIPLAIASALVICLERVDDLSVPGITLVSTPVHVVCHAPHDVL